MPDDIGGVLKAVHERKSGCDIEIALNRITPEQVEALRDRVGRLVVELQIDLARPT